MDRILTGTPPRREGHRDGDDLRESLHHDADLHGHGSTTPQRRNHPGRKGPVRQPPARSPRQRPQLPTAMGRRAAQPTGTRRRSSTSAASGGGKRRGTGAQLAARGQGTRRRGAGPLEDEQDGQDQRVRNQDPAPPSYGTERSGRQPHPRHAAPRASRIPAPATGTERPRRSCRRAACRRKC